VLPPPDTAFAFCTSALEECAVEVEVLLPAVDTAAAGVANDPMDGPRPNSVAMRATGLGAVAACWTELRDAVEVADEEAVDLAVLPLQVDGVTSAIADGGALQLANRPWLRVPEPRAPAEAGFWLLPATAWAWALVVFGAGIAASLTSSGWGRFNSGPKFGAVSAGLLPKVDEMVCPMVQAGLQSGCLLELHHKIKLLLLLCFQNERESGKARKARKKKKTPDD